MPSCELLEGCLFFNDRMAQMPSTSNVIKLMYCTDNFAGCARYMVRCMAGAEKVPADLFPNQVERVEALVGGK